MIKQINSNRPNYNNQIVSNNQFSITEQRNNKFDLEERTAKFGEKIIEFTRSLPKNEITRPLITQLVKCGTSIGANYCKAGDAESRKDFKHKIGVCKKESREAKHFLRMTKEAVPEKAEWLKKTLAGSKRIKPYFFNAIYKKL